MVRDRIKGRKYKRTSIVAAQMGNEIIAPCQYTGTMNHELFENWFQEHLLPALPSVDKKDEEPKVLKYNTFGPVFYLFFRSAILNLAILVFSQILVYLRKTNHFLQI